MKRQVTVFIILMIALNAYSKSIFASESLSKLLKLKIAIKDHKNKKDNKETKTTKTSISSSTLIAEKNLPKRTNNQNTSKIIPYDSTILLSKNLLYSYGTYDLPNRAWYYHKKLNDFPGSGNYNRSSRDFYPQNVITFKTPLEMQELTVSVQFLIYYYGYSDSYNEYPGVENILMVDGIIMDNMVDSTQEGNSGYYFYRSIYLEGSLYNLTAGSHTLSIAGKSRASYVHYININSTYPMIISMVGYPGIS